MINKGKLDHKYLRESLSEKMTDEIKNICELLLEGTNSFDEKYVYKKIYDYVSEHARIIYSEISNMIYNQIEEEEDCEKIASMISNLEILINYSENVMNDEKTSLDKIYTRDAHKAIIKIWDHCNLAQQQYNNLKQTDEELKKKFEKLIKPKIKNVKRGIDKKVEETNRKSEHMISEFVSILGIFAAVVIVFFGGASIFSGVFKNIKDTKWYDVGNGICITGFVLFNTIFMFLYILAKLIDRNIASTPRNYNGKEDPDISHEKFFRRVTKRYPYVICGNILFGFMWFVCFVARIVENLL